MPAINEYYASNNGQLIYAIDLEHSGLTGGILRIAQSNVDITLGGSLYLATAININLPSKDTSGAQDLTVSVSNVDNNAWQALYSIASANRLAKATLKMSLSAYLLDDVASPASGPFVFDVKTVSISDSSATITAAYARIYNSFYPRKRFYTDKYPGLKYSQV